MIGYQNLDVPDFQKLVKYCSIISFRYNVIGGLNPNELEDVYNKLALEIKETNKFNIDLLKSIYVSDNDFEQSFSSKSFKRTTRNHKIVKYIFGSIEKKIFTNDIPHDSDTYTIEHILPESPDANWDQFSDEEINRSIFRIGNLTLLEKNLNRDIENSSYEVKKPIFLKSNSKITQKNSRENDSWTESKIIARQKELAKYAKSVWKIQILE